MKKLVLMADLIQVSTIKYLVLFDKSLALSVHSRQRKFMKSQNQKKKKKIGAGKWYKKQQKDESCRLRDKLRRKTCK